MSREMVDSQYSKTDHGKKRHHHHHRHHHKSVAINDNTDNHSSRTTKRTSDYSPLSDRNDEHRSHHHKSKRQKHDRDDDRSRHRSSPKDNRTEKYHRIRIKEEPVSPRRNEESSKSRLSKEDRTLHSSGRRRHEDSSPNADVPRRNERNHSNDPNPRGSREDERRRDTASKSHQDFKKGKSKLGTFSPSNGEYEWGKKTEEENSKPPAEKQKPNFGLSGKLTEDTNMYNGVVIKYSEPPEARKPKRRWRLYPFKGEEALPMMHIHRQSAFLMGRDRKVVDIPIDHPSCSKQHAALQYRLVPYQREDGSTGKRIKLYIIDLESANGTYVNNNKIDARKYVELMERDVIKFGYSSREYVLLHEGSKDEEDDE